MLPTCSKNLFWPEADNMVPSSDGNMKKHVETEAKAKPELLREMRHMCREWQGWHVRFECAWWDWIMCYCILLYVVIGVWCCCFDWKRCSILNIANMLKKIHHLRGPCWYEIASTPWQMFCYDVTLRRLCACMLSSSTEPSLFEGFLPLLAYCLARVLMVCLICISSGTAEMFCVYIVSVREWNHFLCKWTSRSWVCGAHDCVESHEVYAL